jgi:hypothetical protein
VELLVKERMRRTRKRIETDKGYQESIASIDAEMKRIRFNCARERYEISQRHSIKEYVV